MHSRLDRGRFAATTKMDSRLLEIAPALGLRLVQHLPGSLFSYSNNIQVPESLAELCVRACLHALSSTALE